MRSRVRLAVGVVGLAAMNCICLGGQSQETATHVSTHSQAEPSQAVKQDQKSEAQRGEAKKAAAKLSVNVVFAGGTEFVDAVKTTCQDLQSDKLQDCFAREMKKAKATPAAVEFSKQLGEPGFVRDFKVAGPVDIAYVFYPYRANENQSCLIVNGNPALIDVDNHKLVGSGALKSNATYLEMAKKHKEISLWPGDRYGTETPDVEMGVNAGAHLVVNYRLREQCHACEVLGHAWYTFDFDAKGKFEGAKLIAVSVTHDKASVVRDAKKPVVTGTGDEFTIALPMKGAAASEWTLGKALDTGKLRLIEHSHVAPPTEKGGVGTDELWKFAALRAGTTEIEFQNTTETGKDAKMKPVTFRVVMRGKRPATGAKEPAAKN
jgi:predicted secreted protein